MKPGFYERYRPSLHSEHKPKKTSHADVLVRTSTPGSLTPTVIKSTLPKKALMPARPYRIKAPTIALFLAGERHVADTVPGGAIITIDEAAFKGDKLVNVTWDGREIMMFAQDLRARTERIMVASA